MQSEADTSEKEINNDGKVGFVEYIETLDSDGMSEILVLRAIPSMIQSMRRHGISEFSDIVVRLWIVDMLIDGFKGSSIKRYVGAVHALYKKWIKASAMKPASDPFSIAWADLNIETASEKIKHIEENLEAAERLTKMSVKQDSSAYIYNKAFQYLLFNPFASLQDIVSLKYSDSRPNILHLEDIVTSMRDAPQAQYVFPLQQGKRRTPAIIKDLLVELHATARRARLKFSESFSRDSITSLWIAAAIKEDIPLEEIRGMITQLPDTYSFLSLLPPAAMSEEKKTKILNKVAYSISNKFPGWFVLRMRVGVTPGKIQERLKDKESPLQRQIQYYYPMRQIKKVERKKVKTVDQPILPGLLFIRLPYDKVVALIAIIGDLAWCYRTTSNPSSPYSVIPQSEMMIFQKNIGTFTDDIEMEIVSELPSLKVGDEVMIENGTHLDGQIATIRKVKSEDGTLTFTLQLSETAFIKWKDVSLPASHIKKL